MIYLIVFIASALTAIIGPWVEAPLSLSTLSGLVAITTVILAVKNGQVEIEVSENNTSTKSDANHDSLNQNSESVENSALSDVNNIMQNNDASTHKPTPNNTALPDLRIKSLEEEIENLKSQNNELAREQIELIRKAAIASSSSATRQSAHLANTNELTHAIRRRDSWIQAQQASMSELRNNITSLRRAIDDLAMHHDKKPIVAQNIHSTITPIANSTETATRMINEVGSKISRLIHLSKSLAEAIASESRVGQPVDLSHLITMLSTMDRRLDEIADRTRVSALNAKLLSERPINSESLKVFSEELTDIAAKTSAISNESTSLIPAIEKVKIDLDISIDSNRKHREDTVKFLTSIDSEFEAISHAVTCLSDEVTTGFDRAQQSLSSLQETLALEYNSSTDKFDLVEKMNTLAKSIDITLERLIEISKITTAGTQTNSPEAVT